MTIARPGAPRSIWGTAPPFAAVGFFNRVMNSAGITIAGRFIMEALSDKITPLSKLLSQKLEERA
jgi:hypothetical protein